LAHYKPLGNFSYFLTSDSPFSITFSKKRQYSNPT
jgi:hypothetical protein